MKARLPQAAILFFVIGCLGLAVGCGEENREVIRVDHQIGSFSLSPSVKELVLAPEDTLTLDPGNLFWTYVGTLDRETLTTFRAAQNMSPSGLLTYSGDLTNHGFKPVEVGLLTAPLDDVDEMAFDPNATVMVEPGQTLNFGVEGGFNESLRDITLDMMLPYKDMIFGLITKGGKSIDVSTSGIKLATNPIATAWSVFDKSELKKRRNLKPIHSRLTGTLTNLTAEPVVFRLEFEGEVMYEGEFLALRNEFLYAVELAPYETMNLNEDLNLTLHGVLRYFDFYGRHNGETFYRVIAIGPEAEPALEVKDLFLEFAARKPDVSPDFDI